jgi:hypothetical protein
MLKSSPANDFIAPTASPLNGFIAPDATASNRLVSASNYFALFS